MEKKTKIIIIILTMIIVILSILCTLFATNVIDFQKNEVNDDFDKNNINENEEKITIEKYLGNWYLYSINDYTYINIEKSSTSTTNYVIDIRVNKMADYNDLELHCGDNSVFCQFSGDENHNFALVMAYDQIIIIPYYAPIGTIWTFAVKE